MTVNVSSTNTGALVENFLTILSGFLVPVIAGITTYIAYRQYKIDKDKFRWDLYDRRMETFQSLMRLIEYVMREAKISNEELNKFAVAIDKGSFLFDSKINDYLSEIRNKCFSLRKCERKLEDERLGIGAERDKLAEEEEKILLWFCGEYKGSKRLFERYFKIEK